MASDTALNEGVRVSGGLNCFVCGKPGIERPWKFRDRFFSAPGVWSISQCSGCRVSWLAPMPLPGELERFYRDYFTHRSDTRQPEASALVRSWLRRYGYHGGSRLLFWTERLVPFLDDVLGGLIDWLPPRTDGRLLDVGCGSGAFLRLMRAIGWSVVGLESDSVAADVARSHELTVHVGGLDELDPASFDVVTMHHVIEHVPDPVAFLAQAAKLLRARGTLVVITPNSDSLAASWFREHWVHWDPPRHLHVFTPGSLELIVSKGGLAVESLRTTARNARFAWSASTSIRANRTAGTAERPTGLRRVQSLAFQFLEHLAVTTRPLVGEEIVLMARSPATEGVPAVQLPEEGRARPLPQRDRIRAVVVEE